MGKNEHNRREFLKKASLGLVGGYAALKNGSALAGMMGGGGMGGGGMGGGGGGMGGGGGGVIDPPMGASFTDPANMNLTKSTEKINDVDRTVYTATLQAINSTININGVNAHLMTYNGYFPGPTIKLPKGDILRINFTNSLSGLSGTNLLGHQRGPTNLHAHGWHVSPKAVSMNPPVYSDYLMYDLLPGQTVLHQYDTAKEEASGFHFYHTHRHGLSAEQYWAGMVGALITEDATDSVFNGIETHVMVLKDISLVGSDPAPHDTMMDYMHGLEGNIIMVNGQVNPVLRSMPGQVQRWRILNASNARWYKLSLTNHKMYLVGTDGNLLDKSYPRDQILLSPGERVDILVKASTTAGYYKFLSLPYSRMGNMTSAQITLLTMNVLKGKPASNPIDPNTGLPIDPVKGVSIDPSIMRPMVDQSMVTKTENLQLSMGAGAGYINGITFEDMNHAFTIDSKVMADMPMYEVWTVTNASGMDHPFHQHVDHAYVLEVGGADSSYPLYANMPARKDVVLIPKMGYAKLLVPVMDFDGMTMFHCHILEHEDIGMMGVWDRMMM